jgi:uncharacterized protein (TIGR02246 family)
MAGQTPAGTLRELIAAFNAGDVEGALALYHQDATFVAEPGKLAAGVVAIRGAMEGFVATRPQLEVVIRQTVEGGDVALVCTKWSLTNTGTDGTLAQRNGHGAVILRRLPNGKWVVAVENPWVDGA